MAGISQNAKTGDLPAFGECVGIASKALCGLTEAAAQVRDWLVSLPCDVACVLCQIVGTESTRPLWEAWGTSSFSSLFNYYHRNHEKGSGSCAGWGI